MAALDCRTIPWEEIPLALADWHHGQPAGARSTVRFPRVAPARIDGRLLLDGAGFAAEDLASGAGTTVRVARLRTLADTVGADMRALICGLNPSVVAADAGFGFAGATNRFWAAALAAGLVRVARSPVEALRSDGVGMTDLVKRATPRSNHLQPSEYRDGLDRLERIVGWLRPGVVIFVGLEGWRSALDRRAVPGWQPAGIADRPAYVMPSTSGVNARTSPDELVRHLRSALAGP